MSSGNRQDKPLSNASAGMHHRFPVIDSAVLVLLILLLAVLVVSNRRRQLVDRDLLLLMRNQLDQLDQLKTGTPGDDIAELTSAVEELKADEDEGALERLENTLRITSNRRITELEERLGSRLDNLERLIFTPKEPGDDLSEEYAELGRIGEEEGDYTRASTHYQESLTHKESPEVFFAHAQSLYRGDPEVRDDERIIRSLKSALALDPRHIDSLTLLGTIYLERGDNAEALESYAVLAELSPDDSEIHRIYGRLLVDSGRGGEAVDSLRIASAAFPGRAAVWNDLASAHAALQEHHEAAAAFEEALKAAPGYPLALLGLGRSQIALRRGREAVKSASAYIEKRENDYQGYLLLGDAHASLRNTVRAERAWTKALGTLRAGSPEDIRRREETSIRLVDSMLRRGNYRGVLDIATAALEYGDDAFLLASASTAADRLGDTRAAEGFAERLERMKRGAS